MVFMSGQGEGTESNSNIHVSSVNAAGHIKGWLFSKMVCRISFPSGSVVFFYSWVCETPGKGEKREQFMSIFSLS